MSGGFAKRNSAAASEWAAAQRERRERAAALRAERASASAASGGGVDPRAPTPPSGRLRGEPSHADSLDSFYAEGLPRQPSRGSMADDMRGYEGRTSELEQLSQAFDRKSRGRVTSTAPRRAGSGRVRRAGPIPEAPAERITVHMTPTAAGLVPGGGPPRMHAARAHERNTEYMDDFERGYAALHGGGASAAPRVASGGARRALPGPELGVSGWGRAGMRGRGGGAGRASRAPRVPLDDSVVRHYVADLPKRWLKGPTDPAGALVELSDRPLLCMSVCVAADEVVVGGSDHALYTLDLSSGRKRRTLFTQRQGHTEWVTCVAHVGADGSGGIVSGGMDSKLCLWQSKGVRCRDLLGHTGSVSCVGATGSGSQVISGAYDRTVRVWDVRTAAEVACLRGHSGPVLEMAMGPGLVVTGGRDGLGIAWDLETGAALTEMRGHKGHITGVAWFGDDACNVFLTGAQDGHVRVWDLRSKSEVANVAAHTSDAGSGAVGCIESTTASKAAAMGGDVVVTAGADAAVAVLEPRSGFTVGHKFTEHKDFIYSLYTAGTMCFSGAGDGMLLAHDLVERRVKWGIGANAAAVRCIGGSAEHIVASGDDGNALVFPFV